MTVETKEFAITRTFNAPRDVVWKAWSNAEQLADWWGPVGMALEVRKLEFRPGGIFHYLMKGANNFTMWGRFIYKEITAPERLVYISSFSDEQGNITRAPFGGTEAFPLEVLNTLTFEEHGGKTTLTLRGGPLNASEEEHAFYTGMFPSMQQGFTGTLDQLEAYLSKA